MTINDDFLNYKFWQTATVTDVKQMLSNGANIHARDCDGWTPLMLAARWSKKPKVIKALVEAGADVNAVNIYADTPLYTAVLVNNKPKIIKTLKKLGAIDIGDHFR